MKSNFSERNQKENLRLSGLNEKLQCASYPNGVLVLFLICNNWLSLILFSIALIKKPYERKNTQRENTTTAYHIFQ